MIKKTALPAGFKVNGLACGIKKSGKLDLGLIFSEEPAKAFGLFTSNKIVSGSLELCRKNLKKSRDFQAIIINSGNANCFSKADSFDNAKRVCADLARALGIKKEQILPASTGIIGRPLPVNRIKQALPELITGLSESRLAKIAAAILTTDRFVKISSARFNIGRRTVTICGLAKGAGMIAPSLVPAATMLCFVLTDAHISAGALKKAFGKAVDRSFNSISIDGCMSTNDTALVMSNSLAKNSLVKAGGRGFDKFSSALDRVCLELAKMVVRDGEGATKFIEIKISQARTSQEARHIGLSIANSNLFKTAMFGENKNLGRVVAAIGASGIDVQEKNVKMNTSALNKKKISLAVKLKRGNAQATVYTSDLSPEYISINAKYS